MKKIITLIILFTSIKSFSQDDPKIAFQKRKYDLAVSYYKKDDLKNALDLFSIASRIKPENQIGKDAAKLVGSIKSDLRKLMMEHAVGTWEIFGDKPLWAVSTHNKDDNHKELLEISETKISHYEVNKVTNEKKLVKSEDLVFYSEVESDGLYSQVILANGEIWNCSFNENWTEMHTICVGKKENGKVEKITTNNEELFFVKVK
ncbi:hypothetical protein BD847_2787 [Flavobacterium cutihirudinis]|uniref:Uncharacterized protein n=1 Tax=Flavobacterium cutihirudinis TaxID=1265740 RepID=A0A3D9FSX2_9FLAO|nr:hypothetical protein [Flavobacterium cutihirudinis]RED23722.1 hypothetical protein BD847_2787 [Flavobacterium cutihirudinis]